MRASIALVVFLISSTSTRSSGSAVRYSAASTLFGRPSSAYWATALSFCAQRMRPTGGFSPSSSPVLAGVVEVEVHLAGVGVRELAELEVDDDQAAQAPVEEEQVDPVPLVADAQAPLPADEGEVAAELEQERLELGG